MQLAFVLYKYFPFDGQRRTANHANILGAGHEPGAGGLNLFTVCGSGPARSRRCWEVVRNTNFGTIRLVVLYMPYRLKCKFPTVTSNPYQVVLRVKHVG